MRVHCADVKNLTRPGYQIAVNHKILGQRFGLRHDFPPILIVAINPRVIAVDSGLESGARREAGRRSAIAVGKVHGLIGKPF